MNICKKMVALGPKPGIIPDSKWTTLDHIEHLSLTGKSTPLLIDQALASDSGPELNAQGEKLFALGHFPRGKTQSPAFAHPKGTRLNKIQSNFLRLAQRMSEYQSQIDKIEQHQGRSPHPALGGLTPSQWLVFLDMHLRHHMNIMSEAVRG